MRTTDVPGIRALKGSLSAVAVSHMYKCNPETIRKIWRGETYREGVAPLDTVSPSLEVPDFADAMLKELMNPTKGEKE